MKGLIFLFCLLGTQAAAQDQTVSSVIEQSLTGESVKLIGLISVLSIAPAILIMVTCFPFVVTVLSILRQAIGLQQSPPNMLIISLALFLSYFIMEPVLTEVWQKGIGPFSEGTMTLDAAIEGASGPIRDFLAGRVDPDTFEHLATLRPDLPADTSIRSAPFSVLIPSFMLSEISRAFQIGFLLFLPFLIIDLVVSAVLMSMGMMMVPPAMVSLPFKLAFFVVADGWSLIASSIVKGYF